MSSSSVFKFNNTIYTSLVYERLSWMFRRWLILVSLWLAVVAWVWWVVNLPEEQNYFTSRSLWLGFLFITYAWYGLNFDHQGWLYNKRQLLSPELNNILIRAWHYAKVFKHSEVKPLHIIIASLAYPAGKKLVVRLGLDPKVLVEYVRLNFPAQPNHYPRYAQEVDLLLRAVAGKVLPVSVNEVLIASIEASLKSSRFLTKHGLTSSNLANIYSGSDFKNIFELNQSSNLVNLTFINQQSGLPVCVLRSEVITRTVNELVNKQSVVLLGPPGVGLSAIINGVATSLANIKSDCQVIQIDIIAYLKKPQGARELLIEIGELSKKSPLVVVFPGVEKWYNLPSGLAGAFTCGDLVSKIITAYNLPALLTCHDLVWQQQVRYSFLAQHLSAITVEPLSPNQTIHAISVGLPRWEREWQVEVQYKSIVAAVNLSLQHELNCKLPGAAVAVLAKAAKYVRQIKGVASTVTPADVEHICFRVSDNLLTLLENNKLPFGQSASEIIGSLIKELAQAYRRQGVSLVFTNETMLELVNEAQDQVLGIKHLRSLLAERIERKLAQAGSQQLVKI